MQKLLGPVYRCWLTRRQRLLSEPLTALLNRPRSGLGGEEDVKNRFSR